MFTHGPVICLYAPIPRPGITPLSRSRGSWSSPPRLEYPVHCTFLFAYPIPRLLPPDVPFPSWKAPAGGDVFPLGLCVRCTLRRVTPAWYGDLFFLLRTLKPSFPAPFGFRISWLCHFGFLLPVMSPVPALSPQARPCSPNLLERIQRLPQRSLLPVSFLNSHAPPQCFDRSPVTLPLGLTGPVARPPPPLTCILFLFPRSRPLH